MVCVAGPWKGHGWEIWCRDRGHVCSTHSNQTEVCITPSWTMEQTCSLMGSAAPNWQPPDLQAPISDPNCKGSSDVYCLKSFEADAVFCDAPENGTSHWKLICKTGEWKGKGWEIWCRDQDGLCNMKKEDVCVATRTQWSPEDHCLVHGSARPNWSGH